MCAGRASLSLSIEFFGLSMPFSNRKVHSYTLRYIPFASVSASSRMPGSNTKNIESASTPKHSNISNSYELIDGNISTGVSASTR